MVMQPSLNNYGLYQSAYSQGGALAPTPANNYNMAPSQGYFPNYNPYAYNQLSFAPQQQQTDYGSIVSSPANFKTAGQFVGNGFQLPQNATLNSFGTGLGFAPGGLSYTAAGALPWQTAGGVANSAMAGLPGVAPTAGTLGTTATLSTALGAAGIGALAGSFLGKIGGNTTGGSIGGGLGAGAAALAGLGPVGMIAGGILGGIGGGFFGGKKPAVIASEYAGMIEGKGYNPEHTSFGSKNPQGYANYAQSLQQEVGTYANKLSDKLGISFGKQFTRGGYNSKAGGGFLQLTDQSGNVAQQFTFDPNDPQAKQTAINNMLTNIAKNSGANPDQIKAAMDELAFEGTLAGQVQSAVPFVPIANNQRFADFMAKYKQQGA